MGCDRCRVRRVLCVPLLRALLLNPYKCLSDSEVPTCTYEFIYHIYLDATQLLCLSCIYIPHGCSSTLEVFQTSSRTSMLLVSGRSSTYVRSASHETAYRQSFTTDPYFVCCEQHCQQNTYKARTLFNKHHLDQSEI